MQVTARAPLIAIFLLTAAAVRAQTLTMASGPRAQSLLSKTKGGQEGDVTCGGLDSAVAKALIELGERARSDSLERATTAFRLAERAARCAGSEPLTGAALNALGDALYRRGELDAALATVKESR